jgi:hypothetical protein
MSEQHRKIGVTNPGYFKEEPSPMGGTTFEEAESYLYSSESVTKDIQTKFVIKYQTEFSMPFTSKTLKHG